MHESQSLVSRSDLHTHSYGSVPHHDDFPNWLHQADESLTSYTQVCASFCSAGACAAF